MIPPDPIEDLRMECVSIYRVTDHGTFLFTTVTMPVGSYFVGPPGWTVTPAVLAPLPRLGGVDA